MLVFFKSGHSRHCPVKHSFPEKMDQSEKKAACKILKSEFCKSGNYVNWKLSDQSGSVDFNFGSLPSLGLTKKSVDIKNMVK